MLRELQPIAVAGYANPAKQPFYDSFLKRVGLTWAEVATRGRLRAALSIRRPWKRGWRRRPSRVHSAKPTWATSDGSTQVTSRKRGAS